MSAIFLIRTRLLMMMMGLKNSLFLFLFLFLVSGCGHGSKLSRSKTYKKQSQKSTGFRSNLPQELQESYCSRGDTSDCNHQGPSGFAPMGNSPYGD